MRIAVEGKLYAGVSSEVLDVLGMHASTEKQREAGVTEIVPPYVGQPCSPEQGLKVTVDDVLGVQGSTDGGGENEAAVIGPLSTGSTR